jgi:2'-5' RNA ligase
VRAALVVPFPSVAPPIGGLPAHVTLLFPFPEPEPDVVAATREVMAGVAAFDVVFRGVRRFDGYVYLAPEPPEPFVALTEALVRRFPEWLPYGGAYAEVIPHLTIDAERPPPPLPASAQAAEAVLFALDGERWQPHTAFPFEAR